jgi:CP family cyanate transporter-like MFS transporter
VTELRPLWRGRTTALLGIVLLALALRVAVSSVSPIIGAISADIELTSVGIGLLGALPPVFFAVAGILAPGIAKRVGLERAVVYSIVLIGVGLLVRALADSYFLLALASAIALAATGIANILLPPIVKRYFPDRIGPLTAAYVALLALSTTIPAYGAAPLAEALGWRFSLGVWASTAVFALVPWAIMLAGHKRARAAEAPELLEAPPAVVSRIWRSRTAWAIAMTLSVTSLNTYAMFAWLPEILISTVGMSTIEAGAMLGLFSVVSLPGSIIAPMLVARLRHPGWIILLGTMLFAVGNAGLMLAPATLTWLWVSASGIGPLLFPVALTLINLRTRSQQASAALSGFAQSIGYTLAALGPLLLGVLHDATGGWTIPLFFLVLVALIGIPCAIALVKPGFVEQELGPQP